eukprot:PhM_4_TR18065/c0_g1_i2/m.101950
MNVLERTKDALNPFNKLVAEATRSNGDPVPLPAHTDGIRTAASQSEYGAQQVSRFLLRRIEEHLDKDAVVVAKAARLLADVATDRYVPFLSAMRERAAPLQQWAGKLQMVARRGGELESIAINNLRTALKAINITLPEADAATKYVGLSRDDAAAAPTTTITSSARHAPPTVAKSSYQAEAEAKTRAYHLQRRKAERAAAAAAAAAAANTAHASHHNAATATPKAALDALLKDAKKKRVSAEDLSGVVQSVSAAVDKIECEHERNPTDAFSYSLPDDPFASLRSALACNADNLPQLHKGLLVLEALLVDGNACPALEAAGVLTAEMRSTVDAARSLQCEMSAVKADLVRKTAGGCMSHWPEESAVPTPSSVSLEHPQAHEPPAPAAADNHTHNDMAGMTTVKRGKRRSSHRSSTMPPVLSTQQANQHQLSQQQQQQHPTTTPTTQKQHDDVLSEILSGGSATTTTAKRNVNEDAVAHRQQDMSDIFSAQAPISVAATVPSPQLQQQQQGQVTSRSLDEQYETMLRLQQTVANTQKEVDELVAKARTMFGGAAAGVIASPAPIRNSPAHTKSATTPPPPAPTSLTKRPTPNPVHADPFASLLNDVLSGGNNNNNNNNNNNRSPEAVASSSSGGGSPSQQQPVPVPVAVAAAAVTAPSSSSFSFIK